MKILFLHGWQSTPGGLKPTCLKDHGHEVLNPHLPDDDFDAAVRIAQAEFDQSQPDVVVGSSRGGAVAMNIDCGDTPVVLLCPAWKTWGTATTVKPGTTILHSRADETIGIIKFSIGGTSVLAWKPDWSKEDADRVGQGRHGSLYKKLMAKVEQASKARAICPACAMGLTAEFVFKRLDVDENKIVTVAEFSAGPGMQVESAAGEAVGRIDKDGDGTLSWQEFEAAYQERHANCKPSKPVEGKRPDGRGNATMFARVFMLRNDKNGDGKVDKSEFRGAEMGFNRLDQNKNGFIEIDELGELHQSRMNDPKTMRERLQSGDVRRPPQGRGPRYSTDGSDDNEQ